MIKEGFLLDHCIVVLDVLNDTVAVADPVTGKEFIPIEKFKKIWRYSGITIDRNSVQSI